MTGTLLQSLRQQMLDESDALAGLLRKCLVLGAETGSDSLREWARRELYGYGDEDDVPDYRRLRQVPMAMDQVSGNHWVTGMAIGWGELPSEARTHVHEFVLFRQPVEELERLAAQPSVSFGSPGLAVAQSIWNKQLDMFQQITRLSYSMSGATFAGMLGQIRTKLVEIVADLTVETPLAELPKKERVDAAVIERIGHVGDVYNTKIEGARGPTAIGSGATAVTEGLTVEEVLALLDRIPGEVSGLAEELRAELLAAVTDLRDAVSQEKPDTREVMKQAGRVKTIAGKVGGTAAGATLSGVVEALTTIAMNGGFG